jgi:hypothetical protein
MDLTQATAAAPGKSAPPALQPDSSVRTDVRTLNRDNVRTELRNAVRNEELPHKSSGYGLPCSNCRLYYPANLDTCPACNSVERVSASVAAIISPAQVPAVVALENSVELEKVEQEREEFLKQFKSQLLAAHAEVDNSKAICNLSEHHAQAPESASICKGCYERLQERVDVLEASLHIDLKEAAQVIYDAVWADPSDPSKTYTNAASALITELRKRSGVSSMLGPFHPLGN